MKITTGELAALLNAELRGDPSVTLTTIEPLETATNEHLSFLTAPRDRDNWTHLLELAQQTKAGALLVNEFRDEIQIPQILTEDPMRTIIELASRFYEAPRDFSDVSDKAEVHPSATIGKNVHIGAFSVIGANAHVGDNTIIHPHVVVYPQARIGSNCVLHSGAVIRETVVLGDDCLIQPGGVVGSDGFGYVPDGEYKHRRIPHIGSVELGSGADVGANTAVDRGTLGKTRVGAFVKIDNLVQVAHNVQIGDGSLLCSQVGISGSARIGKGVILAGQVGVADHIRIGDGSRVGAKSGITGSVPEKSDYAGSFAIEASRWRRSQAAFNNLPELVKRVRRLEKKVGSDE